MRISSPFSRGADQENSPRYGGFVLAFIAGAVISRFLPMGGPLSMPEDRLLRTETSALVNKKEPGLLTLKEMKDLWRLPCNYVHDGYYVKESNDVLHQNYLTLTSSELEDEDIPVMIEVGGHDGITKSISLKSSVCLHVNTMLIEATPTTYKTLQSTRAYDHTVHAALCEQESVVMTQFAENTGQNKVNTDSSGATTGGIAVPCTTIDKELDKLAQTYKVDPQKIKLIFLVMDVEGYEHVAIRGLQKYSPMKVDIEIKHAKDSEKAQFEQWQKHHNLAPTKCHKGWQQDQCFNYGRNWEDNLNQKETRTLLYGARKEAPTHTWKTQDVAPAYLYYGE